MEKNVYSFLVGTNGDYDRLVYNVLCELGTVYDICVTVVLAYRPGCSEGVYYDMSQSILPCALIDTSHRFAIKKRNEYMIQRSNYIVCCVDHEQSNASAFMKYAQAKGLEVINIGKLGSR